MCGIIGYIGNQNPKGILLDGLRRLEYRGYDSAGVAILEPMGTELYRCEGRIAGLEARLLDAHFEGTLGIGHTRWATHGAPTEVNAHPHRVGSISLVHNGIIENYLELREELVALGRSFKSETDSEIVASLFDVEIKNGSSLEPAVRKVVRRLKGSFAFVVFSDTEPDKMIAVRDGAPLLIGIGQGEIYVASDVQAILHRTKEIVYLKNQEIAICTRSGVEIRDAAGHLAPVETKTINWNAEQMEKAGYRHYMLKEIHEQPQAIASTIENHIDHKKGIVSFQDLALTKEQLNSFRRISIVACGTARHAALVGQYYFERYARVPVTVDFASEFRYRNPILDSETLLILISQSGETADTLGALREGKERSIPTLAICNVRESSLTREADSTIYTNAGPEIGVASTKAFTTQLAVLYMLAVQMGYSRNALSEAYAAELTSDLQRLPILLDRVLDQEVAIEKIAEEYLDYPFFFYMGRDVHYPIALEGALKLKEISYAHAEGYAAGELKHGPIALIDRSTAVIVLAPTHTAAKNASDDTNEASKVLQEKLMSNLQVVKSRGGQIVSFVTEQELAFQEQSKHSIVTPPVPWGLSPIVLSLPLQLFAYYMALHRGTDVDKPRNLAKSVTVE